jgi:hypothetical protein
MAKLTTIYPTTGFYIPGVAAVVQEVSPERAAELLAYRPPAFTTDPPDEPAATPTDPPDGGSSDSEEE